MKKDELIRKLSDLESRLNSLGDIPGKVSEIDSYTNRAKNAADNSEVEYSRAQKNKEDINNLEQEILKVKSSLYEILDLADQDSQLVQETLKEVESIKESLDESKKRTDSLNEEISAQLGNVSAKVLSNSFDGQADQLELSVSKWFTYLLGSIVALFSVAAIIIYLQLETGHDLWSSAFLLKVTLTTPIIYFIIFVARQYGREKRLLDEYRFKSAVALSFQAFRKQVEEENISEELKGKSHNFILDTIREIYSSPMGNIYKNRDTAEIDRDILVPATLREKE